MNDGNPPPGGQDQDQGGGNRQPARVAPPPPVDVNAILPADGQGNGQDGQQDGRRRRSNASSRSGRNRRQTRSTSASSRTTGPDTEHETDDGDFSHDEGMAQILRPLAAGARMGIAKPDAFTEAQKRKARKDIKEKMRHENIRKAIQAEKKLTQEELRRVDKVDEHEELDKAFETNKDVKADTLGNLRKDMKKVLGPLLGNNLLGLPDVLNGFVEMVNQAEVSEKQAQTLLTSLFTGSFRSELKAMLRQLGLRETIKHLRDFKCPQSTVKECQRRIQRWKLDKKEPSKAIFELYSMLNLANPRATRELVLKYTTQKVMDSLSPTGLDELMAAQKVERVTTGGTLDLYGLTQEVERILGKTASPPQTADIFNLGSDQGTSSSPAAPPAPGAQATSDNLLRETLSEMRRDRQEQQREIAELRREQREQKFEIQRMIQAAAATPPPPPPQVIYQQPPPPTYPPPNMQPASYNNNPPQQQRTGPWPGQGWSQGRQQRNGGQGSQNSQRRSGGYNFQFIKPQHPRYQEACSQLSKANLSHDITLDQPPPIRRNSDGTIEPLAGVILKQFPSHLAVLGLDKGNNRFQLTRQVQEHFAGRCATCGLEGHRSASQYCPMREIADAWEICPTCHLGFHTQCIYNPNFLRSLQGN